MGSEDLDKFRNLRYEDFGRLAKDKSLKPHEKVGFPSVFREGFDNDIFSDIAWKTDWQRAKKILDIGCGCGALVELVMDESAKSGRQLVLNDSIEVLQEIKTHPHVTKIPGKFPGEVNLSGEFEVIVSYSVFHYVFADGQPFEFIDRALMLLAAGGRFLLGDIPNISKRNRFLSTPGGVEFHKKLMGTDKAPEISVQTSEPGRIDDGFIMDVLMKYRRAGIETYLLQQPLGWPLSNSREDILFIKR
jgi:2-polyprenyl-3-methyl-5-hydroxy-6-metoxy-1,4-benzoquinol methylase